MNEMIQRAYSLSKKSLVLALVIVTILGLIPGIGYAEPASFFDTNTTQAIDRFKTIVNEATNDTAEFYVLSITSSSGNIFTVPGDDGSTAYVRATKNGSSISFDRPYTDSYSGATEYYHGWGVSVSSWNEVVNEGIRFEFFEDAALTTELEVNAFGVKTQDWGTCCTTANYTPTGTAEGTAIYTIFDGGSIGQSIELLGNITETISSTIHFVAEIDDQDATFTEVTVAPNGNGEAFRMGGYMIFSVVPQDSVEPGSGSTPSIPPERPDLTAATDLGDSNTDNLTSDTTPDFDVTYTPQNDFDYVNLYADGDLIATSPQAGTTDEITVTLTSTELSAGSHTITARVENGRWHDLSDPSPSMTVTIDSTPPTMNITAAEVSDGETSNDSSLSLTFTSSESTTTFAAGDVSVTNGSLSGFSGSGTSYSATLTPDADGPVTVNVPAGSYTDTAGNDNLAADEFNWTSDQTPPTVEFNPADGETIVANEGDIILTLSEAIRQASDGADLTDSNIDAHITLRDISAGGTDVLFDATIDSAKQVITVSPDSPLDSNKDYFIAIGTSVEDYAGNPLADDSATFQSADATEPTLSSSYPSDGLTDVDIDTDLLLNFSEPVWGQSGGAIEIRRLSDDSLFESIDVTGGQITGDGTENITVDISGPLESLTDYYVLISDGSFQDDEGNPYHGIATTTKLNFTTEYVDLTPPVVTFNPADGDSDVAVGSTITISFDEPVRNLDDSSLTDSNVDSLITLKDTDDSGTDIPFDATIDSAKQVITINPSSNFASEQVVYVAIGATVEDDSDNAISAANATFTVEDVNPPTLLSTTPPDDGVDVGVSDNLILTFDEPVDVEFGAVTIYHSSDDSVFENMSVTSTTQVSGSGTDTITLNPGGTFAYETGYYVQVDATAFDDAAGNSYAGFADNTTWNFTTEAENQPPTANDDSASTDEDSVVTIDALANDTDPDATDVLSVTDVDTTGTTGQVVDNGDGTFDYDPDGQFEDLAVGESATDSFGYTISDGNGGSDTAAVTVTVNGVNDAPSISTCEITPDPAYTADDLTANYSGWDDPEGDPANVEYAWFVNSTHLSGYDNVSTLPSSQFSHSDTVELTCTPVDSEGLSGTALSDSMVISNSTPVAVDDSDSTVEDTPVTVDVLDNDSDADAGDTLTITSVTQGSHGTVTNNGTDVTYEPDANYYGTDTFTYTMEDDQGASDTATVTITVTESTDMDVRGSGVSINNGDGTPSASDDTDFGSTTLFLGTVEHTFTIENLGTVDLALTGTPRVEITGSHAADFTVTALPASPLSDGGTTTFSIEFDPSGAGLREAVVSIETDDLTDPFTFAVQGTATVHDSDGDGVTDNVEGDGDRDGDGVADYQDYDPTGYFYDEATGELISGGSITVSGPGVVTILEDGSTGYYQFLTDGTAGTYNLAVVLPSGFALSGACLQGDPPAYDPTGEPEPVNLGNGEDADTGYLTSSACTTFYLSFDLAAGDPIIINNNIPLERLPLPDTGFAPGQVTELAQQPENKEYWNLSGLWLEIPKIDVSTPIVGVPALDGVWDVTWLGNQAGYLTGTSFPTLSGNTVITGHVWNADNQPGIFANLKQLQRGDEVYIQAWGQVYTYQVQQTRLLSPYVSGPVLEHKEGDWITLFTCEDYAQFWEGYGYRRMIRAVLVDVSPAR